MASVKPIAAKHKYHMYRRIEPKTDQSSATYRCMLPGCRHYLREEFMEGQIAVCYVCEEQFEITKAIFYPRKIRKVHCPSCTRATFNRKTGRYEKKKEILPDNIIMDTLDDIIMGKIK